MKMFTLLPVTDKEQKQYKRNPKQWIEAKIEFIRPHNPLVSSVFDAVIQNNLPDRDFYLFLSYYAMDRVLRLEQELTRLKNTETEQ